MAQKTDMNSLKNCGLPAFTFAGFQFPKYVWSLPRGPLSTRTPARYTSSYYHAPKPVSGTHPGGGFYLDSDGMPGLRWQWADDVDGVRIQHTGWYTDADGIGETIRGLVLRLPHGRGFLAGWSMGSGMSSTFDGYIYPDERSAAYAADSMAENAAETEREYQEEETRQREIETARETVHALNRQALELIRAIKADRDRFSPPICQALRDRVADLLAARAEQFRVIQEG